MATEPLSKEKAGAPRGYLAAAAVCWAISLALPAVVVSGDALQSLHLLLIGWLGPLYGQLGWLANPFFLLSWILLAIPKPTGALLSGLAAALFAGSVLLNRGFLLDEGGSMGEMESFLSGYWFWSLSCWILVAGAISHMVRTTEVRT